MIRIRNLGGPQGGMVAYEVGINHHPAIATFLHRRSDGLAACLRAAADAVDESEVLHG